MINVQRSARTMADYHDRDRGRGRRGKRGRRRDFYGSERHDRDEYYRDDRSSPSSQTQNASQPPFKTPIILAKPNRDNQQQQVSSGSPKSQGEAFDYGKSQDSQMTGGRYFSESDTGSQPTVSDRPPMIIMRPKEEARPTPPVLLTRPKHSSNEENSSPASTSETSAPTSSSYQIQQRKSSVPSGAISVATPNNAAIPTTNSTSVPVTVKSANASRITVVPRMTRSVKLIDDNFSWCDTAMEMLIDQTDFISVGVLGMQGVGKSTLLSVLASNGLIDLHKELAFKSQPREVRELGAHQTMGVDLFVTSERVVLLDTQPILSSSVLDYLVHNDKKYPPEYTSAENCVEMQSLQIASFLMTVCNVVVIVMDWFVDLNLLKFIQTAEMLKPATPTASHDNSTENHEYYPYLVFLLNKADREDFSVENYRAMQEIIMKVFEKSKLQFRGPLTIANGKLVPGLNRNTIQHNCNLFLIPQADEKNEEGGDAENFSEMVGYKGHPGYKNLMRAFRNKLFSTPHKLLTHTTLSERNWFHYAARSWEAIKKSQLFVEYNRLLP